jgi:hypothetical protein
MTTARVKIGTVIFHRWDPVQGLVERQIVFDSIDALFSRCLEITSGETVDRVVLDGTDQSGAARRLTLSFQAATVSSPPTE